MLRRWGFLGRSRVKELTGCPTSDEDVHRQKLPLEEDTKRPMPEMAKSRESADLRLSASATR